MSNPPSQSNINIELRQIQVDVRQCQVNVRHFKGDVRRYFDNADIASEVDVHRVVDEHDDGLPDYAEE